MKVWREKIENVLENKEWFINSRTGRESLGFFDFNINNIAATSIIWQESRYKLLQIASETFMPSLISLSKLGYKAYLFICRDFKNKESKVELYKKIWKDPKFKLDYTLDFNKLLLGDEVVISLENGNYFFTSAEFEITTFYEILKFVNLRPERHFVIFSKNKDYLEKSEIENMFYKAYDTSHKYLNFDSYKLSLNLAQKNDVFLRYMTWGHETDIGITYNPNIFREHE